MRRQKQSLILLLCAAALLFAACTDQREETTAPPTEPPTEPPTTEEPTTEEIQYVTVPAVSAGTSVRMAMNIIDNAGLWYDWPAELGEPSDKDKAVVTSISPAAGTKLEKKPGEERPTIPIVIYYTVPED